MSKNLRLVVLAALSFTAAQEARSQVLLDAKAGFNVLSQLRASGGSTDPISSFLGGAALHYMISSQVGLFGGADYTQRGFEAVSGDTYTASYVDLTFGFGFRYGSWAGSTALTKLGAFYAMPMGELKNGDTVGAGTKPSFGLLLETQSIFKINESLGLGPVLSLKYGLGNGFEAPNPNRFKNLNDFGIALGLALQF